MLSNQHYTHRANQKLRSWANAVFQNRGVCGQAVPSFPSPSPVNHFFCSCPNFLDEPREETLATQAIVGQVCHTTGIICLSPALEAASSKSSITLGSIASAVVKAHASYKYVSGAYLNATPYVVWMGLPLVLAHAGAYPGTPVIRSPEKPTLPGKFQFQTIKIT